MIIKITSIKKPDFTYLLAYLLKHWTPAQSKHNPPFIIRQNIKGERPRDWVRCFLENEQYRQIKRANSTILTHEIVSFSKEDAVNLTPEKLEDIARQYIRLRNPKGMYVAVPHFDTGNYHVHFMCSGIEYRTGKSLRMTWKQFREFKQQMEEFQLQRYPELSHSVVDHSGTNQELSKETPYEYQTRKQTKKPTQKEVLKYHIVRAYHQATSVDHFQQLLQSSGIEIYMRRRKLQGVIFKTIKYRFTRLGFGNLVQKLQEQESKVQQNRTIQRRRNTKEKNIDLEK